MKAYRFKEKPTTVIDSPICISVGGVGPPFFSLRKCWLSKYVGGAIKFFMSFSFFFFIIQSLQVMVFFNYKICIQTLLEKI